MSGSQAVRSGGRGPAGCPHLSAGLDFPASGFHFHLPRFHLGSMCVGVHPCVWRAGDVMQKSEGPGDGEIVSKSLIHMAEAPAGKYSRRWCPCPQKNCPHPTAQPLWNLLMSGCQEGWGPERCGLRRRPSGSRPAGSGRQVGHTRTQVHTYTRTACGRWPVLRHSLPLCSH